MTRTSRSQETHAVEQSDQTRAESVALPVPDGPMLSGRRGQGT